MKRILAALLSTFAVIVSIAGCGEDRKEFPLSGSQEYEAPEDLARDLESGGITCSRLQKRENIVQAAGGADCWVVVSTGEEDQLVILVFSSEKNREEQIAIARRVGEEVGQYAYIEGGNWLVNCAFTSQCEKVHDILGGDLQRKSFY